ncbi:MAG: hypothetical protein HY819_11555 [Acidobacteria bacterium]|nr:hypothetical protein [Acidobacteriota bacterium]
MKDIQVFRFIEELDAFIVTEEFKYVSKQLGLEEWNPVVWIGRLLIMDNDFGEHLFDNWEEREEKEVLAQKLGVDSSDLMIIVADKFINEQDGPCNIPEIRKAFWTDVLKSLRLSFDLLFQKARLMNERTKELFPEDYISDLEQRITRIKNELAN